MIFGGQTNPGDYHCVAFDEVTIKKHLTATGFEVISILEEDIPQSRGLINLNMTVRAKKISTVKQSTVDKTGSNLKVVQDTTKTEKQVPYAEKPSVSGGAFEGLDFSEPTTAPEEKPVHENQQKAADHKTSRLQPPYLNIVWEGSQFVYHSLALINREHCSNIIDTGLAELTIVPYEKDTVDPAINPKYKKLAGHDIRIKPAVPEDVSKLPYVWIRHQWPPKSEPPKGAKWIIMQPWEFTALRKDFAELFSQADEIWTPSTFSRSSFINSGIDFNKVQVIPNGIDPDLFKPEGPVYNLKTQKRFKILFVGGTIYRKGIDILLKAYLKVFKREDNVCLVIKDMGGESFYRGQNAKDYINKLQNDPAAPEIIYIDEYLDEEQMAGLYRACDVFACTYRGEGFSLPTLESMACGLPVIVTKGGATDDFVTDEFGWFIPAEKKSIGDMLDDKPLTGEALLLEPDLNETAQILRSIYSDPADIIFRGIAASYTARTMWTWKRASIKMLSRLDYLYGLHMAAEAEKTLTDSRDGSIILYEGESDFNAGDFDSAVLKYKKAIETGSLSAKYRAHTLLKLAYIYTLNEQFDLADKYLIEAAILMPGNPDVIYIRASLLSAKGDWIEMLETITPLLENWAAVKYDSTLGYGLDGLLCVTGDGLLETGDPEASLKVFTEALKYNNNNPYACYGAARCFITADALKEAKDMLEWALKIKPDFTEARDELTKLNDLI